jgi:uncharacterized membrane protein YeiH
MVATEFHVPLPFVYGATLFWAASGAVVGIRRGFDIIGVFVVALLSSTGGGLLRDAICLHRAPLLLSDPAYLSLIVGTTAVLTLFTEPLTRLLSQQATQAIVDVMDAAGIPAFAVIGMQMAEHEGLPIPSVVFVGVVNGVGGGLLRDVVVREVPALLRPGQFTTLFLLLACGVFVTLTHAFDVRAMTAGWVAAPFFLVLRLLAVRHNWHSRPLVQIDRRAPANL